MQIDGYGGRIGSATSDISVLNGVLDRSIVSEPLPERKCDNRKCGNWYKPRAEGDLYCSEPCDLDANKQFKPKRRTLILSKK
jgi:hypothetical protein